MCFLGNRVLSISTLESCSSRLKETEIATRPHLHSTILPHGVAAAGDDCWHCWQWAALLKRIHASDMKIGQQSGLRNAACFVQLRVAFMVMGYSEISVFVLSF